MMTSWRSVMPTGETAEAADWKTVDNKKMGRASSSVGQQGDGPGWL